MVPALQFDYWQWVALALATPVAVWGAWPFHRAAGLNLRHGATTMDTLVSLGDHRRVRCGRSTRCSSAAPVTRPCACRFAPDARLRQTAQAADLYLEVAAVRDRLPARRPLRRGPRQAPLGRRAARPARPGGQGRRGPARRRSRSRDAGRGSSRSATCSSCAPARPSPPTASWSRAVSAVDASTADRRDVPVEVGPGDAVTGRHRQRRRAAGRARHPGRRRHPAGADRPAGRARPRTARPPVQRLADRVSAVFVPVVHRDRAADPRSAGCWPPATPSRRSPPPSRC